MNFRLLKYGSTSWIIDHRNNILAVKIYSVLLDQCWENQILYFLFCSTPRCIFQKCTVARCRLVWCGLHSCSGALSPRQLFLHSCSGALWPRQLFLFKTKLIIWGRVAVSKSLKILAMPRRGGGGGSDPAKLFCGFYRLKICENTGISRKMPGKGRPQSLWWSHFQMVGGKVLHFLVK